ncbi:MAG TPA: CheR family methyltransferase [Rubricoccaceae bacterium]
MSDTPDASGPPQNGAPDDRALVVAGLGASAGGLGAFEAFFAGLPEIDGVAFVVILHLDPDDESRLADIQAGLPLPVTQVTEAVTIERGHVYVVPPGKNLLVENGRLVLAPIEDERVQRRPVDHFFRTLAQAYGERAVGVILSGTGANGTVGVRALKEAGGLVLAQDPADARFGEMPRSAIASGIVDAVGTAGALAAEVVAYAHRLWSGRLPDTPKELPEDGARALQSVLNQLRIRTGHDFAHYKRATVLRRLDRRLHVTGTGSLTEYLDLLRDDASESQALLDDLLISVTNFFRDAEAFVAFEQALPRLFAGKQANDEIRAWVAGCATGEEAYSVAMLLLEHAATLSEPPRVQVFATDLSGAAIQTARSGVYPESIEADVSPERLRQFFSHLDGHYHVGEELREAVLFAPHSLVADPPFSRLDVMTCRNVLIYFQPELQQKALALFHYALRPGGLLFLGPSESAEEPSMLFDTLSKRARLYCRQDAATPVPALSRLSHVGGASLFHDGVHVGALADRLGGTPAERKASDAEQVHRALREQAAPPSVLVSMTGDVVHISDGAAAFLTISAGTPTRQITGMLRPEFRGAVQSVLFQAWRGDQGAEAGSVQAGRVEADLGGTTRSVGVRAQLDSTGQFVQIVFDVLPLLAAPSGSASLSGDSASAEVLRLTQEALRQTQEQLQVAVEEFETSHEELLLQNEELQSANEEIRSTAEELETSKEEAQSMAEELRTVNDELKVRMEESARATSDLENLVASTEIATLFLDRSLRIQRFTPSVRELFHVLPTDIGRPLADLAPRFGEACIVEDSETVLARLTPQEREVRTEEGRWYLVHVRPYRTSEDRIGGVVVTCVDITRRKADEEAIRASAEQASFTAMLADALQKESDPAEVQAVAARVLGQHLGASRVHYGDVDGDHVVVEQNYTDGVEPQQGRFEMAAFGPARAGALRAGQTLVLPDTAAAADLPPSARAAYVSAGIAAEVGVPLVKKDRLQAVLLVHQAAPRAWTPAEVTLIEAAAERTWLAVEQAQAEQALHASETRLRQVAEAVPDVLFRLSADGTVDFVNGQFEAMTGHGSEDALRTHMWPDLVHPDDRAQTEAAWRDARDREERYEVRHRLLTPDGPCWVITRARPVHGPDGAVSAWFGTITDIDALMRAEAEARDLVETLEARVAARTQEVRQLAARLSNAEHEERRRLAHVLHDDLQQQLAGLSIMISLLGQSEASEAAELRSRAAEIVTGASQLTRSLAAELSPQTLQSPDLVDTLDWLAELKRTQLQMDIGVETGGPVPVPDPDTRALLYQSLRELLFNVVKHAGVREATVRAHRDGPDVVVEVEDRGKGFAPGAGSKTGGFGLFSVRERLELAGGRLGLDTAPGEGTRVTLTLPAGSPSDGGRPLEARFRREDPGGGPA